MVAWWEAVVMVGWGLVGWGVGEPVVFPPCVYPCCGAVRVWGLTEAVRLSLVSSRRFSPQAFTGRFKLTLPHFSSREVQEQELLSSDFLLALLLG